MFVKLGMMELCLLLVVLDKNFLERFVVNGGGVWMLGEVWRCGKLRLVCVRSVSEETFGRAATEREDGFEVVEVFEEVLG